MSGGGSVHEEWVHFTYSPTTAEWVNLSLHTSNVAASLHEEAVEGGLEIEVRPYHHCNEGIEQ